MSGLDQFSLKGKVAMVTGCRRGIGLAIAAALAEAGADVIGVSRSLETTGSEVERRVTAAGRRFWGFACDFSQRAEVKTFLREAAERCPAVDVLVNNAGTIQRQPAVDHSEANWDDVIDTNLTAPWLISQAIGRHMVERGSGKIIFIASLLTFQGGITVPGYAASKGAIGQLTKALANEWAGAGVQVNALAPGYIATDNTNALRADPQRSSAILSRIPAGRWGQAEDLAGAAVFLASRAGDYVNGHVLVVDGGWMGR